MKKIFLIIPIMMAPLAANANFYITAWAEALTDREREFKPDITDQWMTVGTKIDFLDKIIAKASVGYAFENGFRFEADIAQASLREKGSGSKSFNGGLGVESVRGLYDIKNCTRFTPYLGVGVYGFSWRNGSLDAYDFSGILGLSARLAEGLSLDLQYERNWYRDPNYKIEVLGLGTLTGTVKNGLNLWKIGLRYEF
ncbi:MAG: hypothetical protein FWD33_02910 [Alphaproteobacteria bacterium]|nr:hypothetical protein [Alphaproteobacteria bacterium]